MKRIIRIATLIAISLLIVGPMSGLASGEGLWYQAEDEGKTYDKKFVAYAGDDSYTQNNMTISALVESVTHFSDKQEIDIWVTATGACKEKLKYYDDYDYYELYTTAGTRLSANLGNNAPDGAQLDLDTSWNYRANMTDQDNDIGGTQDKDASDYVELAALFTAEEAIAKVPYLGTAYHAATFYQTHFASGGAMEADHEGTGPDADASELFRTRNTEYWNMPEGGTIPYLYQAETHFTITIPDDPETGESVGSEFDIKISAKNIMNSWQLHGAGPEPKDGAKASLTIPVHNGEIKSIYSANSGTGGTDDVTGTTTTSDDGLYTYTDTIAVNTNQPYSELPKVDVKVDWGDGNQEIVRNDWEPYYWGYNIYDGYYTKKKYIDISHTYDLAGEEVDPGQQKTFPIDITAESSEGYGKWSKQISYGLTIDYEDTTDPSVSIQNPSDGSTYYGGQTISIDWTGSDSYSGIDHYEWRVDGNSWNDVGTSTSDSCYFDVDDHTVEVKAYDNAGNTNLDSVNFTVATDDTTDPSVSIQNPSDGSTYSGSQSITIDWTGSDSYSGIDHYEWRWVDETSWYNVGTSTSDSCSFFTGDHTVEVRAYDNAGNTNLDSVSFTVESDGGGGGGCPYVSPWNGTEYNRENNILPQSEFNSGKVTDHYKLDSDLQEKNGSYTMKIEEFENSEDFIDQMDLYTIDHKEGYNVGVTSEGEYMTYKDSEPPESAHNSTGADITDLVEVKDDGKTHQMNRDSEIVLDYGDMSKSKWVHKKLVLRSSGFSSYTDENASGDMYPGWGIKPKSLNVSIKAGNSEWHKVSTVHPRNHPHDHVIPLQDSIRELLKKNPHLKDFKVQIESTKRHNLDYVGIDDSVPQPVKIQKANLTEAIKTNIDGYSSERTERLRNDSMAAVHLTPGEECTVKFDVPDQLPGRAFEERDFVLRTKGWYTKYQ